MLRRQTLLTEEEIEKINRICEKENRSFSNTLRCLVRHSLKDYTDDKDGKKE